MRCMLESTIIVHASLKPTDVASTFQKVHTETFLLSRKYFEYICCFFQRDSFLFNTHCMWFSFVLSNSIRFMPSGTMIFKCFSSSILSSKSPKSTHLFLYMLIKLANFYFWQQFALYIVVLNCIEKIRMKCHSYHLNQENVSQKCRERAKLSTEQMQIYLN